MDASGHAAVATVLARLIHPLPEAEFLRDHWERMPLHLRGDRGRYAAILSEEDLDRTITSADLRYPAIQLARHGGYFPPEVYTKSVKHGSEVFSGVPDIEKIRSEYREGATIVLPAFHRTWAPLRELCLTFEREMSHAVHANVYLTAGNTTGFGPHYDTHDVFVLQIGGRKHWRVYEPPIALPHRSQPFARTGYVPPAPLLECELNPGDLLYLPRGYVHGAATSDSHSAHVTVGVTIYTWVELLAEWLLSSKILARFREALPIGFAGTEKQGLEDALKNGLMDRIAELGDRSNYDELIETFKQRVRSTQPREKVVFASNVRVIGPGTKLAVPEKHRYCVTTKNGNTALEFDGRTLVLPQGVRPTLDAICARETFRIGDLPRYLEDHATLAFVRYLEEERFLIQVSG